MIDKIFQCPFERCSRNYGSDVSLNLHMKLKHNSGTKTERENLAKEICLAEEKGARIKITLNFPPGYLEEFRENFRKENSLWSLSLVATIIMHKIDDKVKNSLESIFLYLVKKS